MLITVAYGTTFVQSQRVVSPQPKFLACWWLFSDGMNVIGNLGSQYADAYVS